MTLQAARPLSADEVLEALEVALRAQGFALIQAGDTYSVVPLAVAPRRVAGVRLPGDRFTSQKAIDAWLNSSYKPARLDSTLIPMRLTEYPPPRLGP
jgi:hypothetical protein